MKALPVDDWMEEREMSVGDLLRATGLEKKVVEAIAGGRWTPTIEQRRRIAGALGVDIEEVFWGHTCQVEHVYGHGPQFGRSP
jgi:transcriptional regulator with XRE-family HTH domain